MNFRFSSVVNQCHCYPCVLTGSCLDENLTKIKKIKKPVYLLHCITSLSLHPVDEKDEHVAMTQPDVHVSSFPQHVMLMSGFIRDG